MRVVIVTGTRPHHKSLCASIAQLYNVVGIIHPVEKHSPISARVRHVIQQAEAHGWPLTIMSGLGKVSTWIGNRRNLSNAPSGTPLDFSPGVTAYDRIPPALIHNNCDVQDTSCHNLLRSLRPDVTLCLGGPIYPKPFIDASPLMLNFHSGLSPIYNGTASIQFAFANGHPHLCGGTLMLMGVEVDAGGILGHYLPAIESGDSPNSLFDKTVRGAEFMYARILEQIKTRGNPGQFIPQPRSLFLTQGFQFGWYQREMIARYLRTDRPARFARTESFVEYWRENSADAARDTYRSTLEDLLWKPAGRLKDAP